MTAPYPVLSPAFSPEGGADEPVTAVDRVLASMAADEPWDYDHPTQLQLQLAAVDERLRTRRAQVPLVEQKASQLGIDAIESLDDLAMLLFAPDVYKSYPDSLVTKGRWAQLLRWLDATSSHRLDQVDVEGVTDIDGFVDSVFAAGHRIVTTSGTSGKNSLAPESLLDAERSAEAAARAYSFMWGVEPGVDRPLFYTGNRSGAYRGVWYVDALQRAFGTPETTYTLFEEAFSLREVGETAALNRAMANGTANPSDIARLRGAQEHARERADRAFDRFIELLVAHSQEPVLLWGQVYPWYEVMRRARERGASIAFQPGSALVAAGGLKNNSLPSGWMDDFRAFYSIRTRAGYGQAEIHGPYPECAEGNWHVPPNIVVVLLDPDTRSVVNPESGRAAGILGSFDIALDGRWGGLMTSDWVEADFSPCACGLGSPTILSCQRFDGAAAGDDRLNCQGRVEMYIRGALT